MLKLHFRILSHKKINHRPFICSYFYSNNHNRNLSHDVKFVKQLSVFTSTKRNYVLNIGFSNVCTKKNLSTQYNNHVRHYSSSTESVETSVTPGPSLDPLDDNDVVPLKQFSGVFRLISESTPTLFVQDLLISLHTSTGLPWWSTIMLSVIVIRATIIFPMLVYQHYLTAKCTNLEPEIERVGRYLHYEVGNEMHTHGWTQGKMLLVFSSRLSKERKKIYVRENCHPNKHFIIMGIQGFIWICMSIAIRNLCHMAPFYNDAAYEIYKEFKNGGFGWISNLTIPDKYWIFPILSGVMTLINIEVQNKMMVKRTMLHIYFTMIGRLLTLLIIYVSSCVPSCLVLYWMTSTTCAFLQHLLLYLPRFRRLVKIPKTDNERSRPYLYLWTEIKKKFT